LVRAEHDRPGGGALDERREHTPVQQVEAFTAQLKRNTRKKLLFAFTFKLIKIYCFHKTAIIQLFYSFKKILKSQNDEVLFTRLKEGIRKQPVERRRQHGSCGSAGGR
jgi:hypothetical protein